MAPFKFLSLTSASLFLLQGTYTRASQNSGAQNGYTTIDCLAPINDARALVGFAAFKAAQKDDSSGLDALLTKTDDTSLKSKLCSAVKSGGGTVVDTGDATRGIAYQGQTGANGDCAAAVTSFKGGIAALGSERPGKYQKNVAPFNVASTVSFASIFYPKDDGEVECAYVTCEAAASGGGSGGASTQADASSGAGDATATKNALVCLTKPATLVEGKEPFSEEEFKQLQKLAGSGVNSMPTFLALVAAAAGLILL